MSVRINIILLAGCMAVIFALPACESEQVRINGPVYKGTAGVFIVNEGNFMSENASLSFYDYGEKKVYNHIFFAANKIPLGDVAQSMTFSGTRAFIVINNSAKICCINADDATFTGKITGFVSPRYMLILNDHKAYVSDMYARKIYISDPIGLTVTGSIDTDNHSGVFYQHSAEKMIRSGNQVFAACWSFDNKILVIDMLSDHVTDSITVAKQPNSMVLDRNGDLWVLSDGGFTGSSYGVDMPELVRINTATHRIEKQFRFVSEDLSPNNLVINRKGDTLFFLNSGIYRMSISADHLPEHPLIKENDRRFYSLGIDPASADLYIGDALDYQQAGIIYRYRADLFMADSFRVGIIPGSFYFTGE
jgi:hypothetical protein